jgi:hypothetical protein
MHGTIEEGNILLGEYKNGSTEGFSTNFKDRSLKYQKNDPGAKKYYGYKILTYF